MNKYNLIYITTKNLKEAETIGEYIVSNRFASCVNIIDNMKSIYHWQGKIEKSKEVIIIAKTKVKLTNKLIVEVKNIHSYKIPCIIAIPIISGDSDFLNWIEKECI